MEKEIVKEIVIVMYSLYLYFPSEFTSSTTKSLVIVRDDKRSYVCK